MLRHYLHKLNSLKLRAKFALAILIIIALILVSFDGIVLRFQHSKLVQNLEERNITLAKNMASDAVDALLLRDFLQLDRQVNTIKQTPLCIYAYILDNTGRVVAHTDKHFLGKLYPLPEVKSITPQDRQEDGHRIREYYVPITIDDEILGFGVLGIDKDRTSDLIEKGLKELRYNLFFTSALLFGFAMLFSSSLAGLLTKRLSLLKEKMRLVQRGDFNVEIPNENVIKCWEVFNCPHQDCPAYGKLRCWTIPNTNS